MRCPLCKNTSLSFKSLEEHLIAKECDKCGGLWLSSKEYWKWLKKDKPALPEKPFADVDYDVTDSQTPKICADCGHIMLRFKVGHGISFYLDHCNSCNGVWLDKNEWESLKSRNLHDDLHRIFTTPWQDQLRAEEMEGRMEKIYAEKFGDDYPEIKKIRQTLDAHPKKDEILAYLNDPEPYKI